MPPDGLPGAISRAYAWHRAFGNARFETALATFVVNEAHPRVWSANHVSRVAASTRAEIETVIAEMEDRFAHCDHRAVVTDGFTPPSFTARLAFDSFREQTPVIQMILIDEPPRSAPSDVVLRAVDADTDWTLLARLVEANFREGRPSEPKETALEVARGLVDGYRRKSRVAQFFIAEIPGAPCAYGSMVECPNDLGMLEDFFTLPEFRGRGVAATILRHCIGRLRDKGRRNIFIGAYATGRARHLYARLGFAPLMISREWVKA